MIAAPRPAYAWLLLAMSAIAPLTSACARPAPAAPAAATQGADRAAVDFYRWYVALLAHDKEASDDPANYRRYVATAFRTRIERQTNSADGIDADPFIRTQDYLDGWLSHVAAGPVLGSGSSVTTTVTLGVGKDSWRLAVTMIREGGMWKVAGVSKA